MIFSNIFPIPLRIVIGRSLLGNEVFYLAGFGMETHFVIFQLVKKVLCCMSLEKRVGGGPVGAVDRCHHFGYTVMSNVGVESAGIDGRSWFVVRNWSKAVT